MGSSGSSEEFLGSFGGWEILKVYLTELFFVRSRKNALLIQIGVQIIWDTVDWMNGSWDAYLASPANFAGVDDVIATFTKERESLVTSNAIPNL